MPVGLISVCIQQVTPGSLSRAEPVRMTITGPGRMYSKSPGLDMGITASSSPEDRLLHSTYSYRSQMLFHLETRLSFYHKSTRSAYVGQSIILCNLLPSKVRHYGYTEIFYIWSDQTYTWTSIILFLWFVTAAILNFAQKLYSLLDKVL